MRTTGDAALRQEALWLGLKQGGGWQQNDPEGAPVFSDGMVGLFGFRVRGDLTTAVWAEHVDRDCGYMDFYMDCCVPDG